MAEDNSPNWVDQYTRLAETAHTVSADEVIRFLDTNIEEGLAGKEGERRLKICGTHKIKDDKGPGYLKVLLRQIFNAMNLVLLSAVIVLFCITAYTEAGIVLAIIVGNVGLGTWQEVKAAKNIDALRKMNFPTAKVIRNGNIVHDFKTENIVPGDVIELEPGDTVPADIRLVEAVNFSTLETAITGEAVAVRKRDDQQFSAECPIGDRLNMAFWTCKVESGRARGVVTGTGRHAVVGKIAASLQGEKQPLAWGEPKDFWDRARAHFQGVMDQIAEFLGLRGGTPLQQKLSKLALYLLGMACVFVLIVFVVNGMKASKEVSIYAVAAGVCMIPCSLILVLTVVHTRGTNAMQKRHVIVRNPKKLEALGGVTNVCSDKTGTLTLGQMIVKAAWLPGKGTFRVLANDANNPTTGIVGFEPEEPVDLDLDADTIEENRVDAEQEANNSASLADYLKVASLANLARVNPPREEGGEWHTQGSATDIAIQVFACRFNHDHIRLSSGPNARWKRVAEFHFDSQIKKMSAVFEELSSEKQYLFTKGAVERVLDSCTHINQDGDVVPLTQNIRDRIESNMRALASFGLRVLALASRADFVKIGENEERARAELETNLVFRGLIGLYDAPRPESRKAVRQLLGGGITVHMLTGDHLETARAIAKQVGIVPSTQDLPDAVLRSMVMAASEFDALTHDEIDAMPELPLVIARCSPDTKVNMIEALHRRGKFVSMTGDGVNDAPSLNKADVGVAMGSGSDVAKDAADIVLTDDNFKSIEAAIEEGRRMHDNTQRFILLVLAQNVAQELTMQIGLVFMDSSGISVFPISPVQAIYIIMVSSLPCIGLGYHRAQKDIMTRPPNIEGIFTKEFMLDLIVYGILMGVCCSSTNFLVIYAWGDGNLGRNCNNEYSAACDTVARARSTCFALLTSYCVFLAFMLLHPRKSVFRKSSLMELVSNKFLLYSVLIVFFSVFPLIYIPVLNTKLFRHQAIRWEWGIVFGFIIFFFTFVEAWKWGKRIWCRYRGIEPVYRKQEDVDLEKKAFGPWVTLSSTESPSINEK